MTARVLKAKFKVIKPTLKEPHAVRLHRAISWLDCAEGNLTNPDLHFVSLWVAFNACYAIDLGKTNYPSEKESFNEFINKLVQNDHEQRFFNLLWHQFSTNVRILIENQYVFKPFWDYQRGDITEWQKSFNHSIYQSMQFVTNNDVPALLKVVLDRLYMLRNQIIHGGATFKSGINRKQLSNATNMLQLLVPLIIEIMLDNKNIDWGEIYYPVITM